MLGGKLLTEHQILKATRPGIKRIIFDHNLNGLTRKGVGHVLPKAFTHGYRSVYFWRGGIVQYH